MKPFSPAETEAAVQRQWKAGDVYRAVETTDRPKYFCVSMLPSAAGRTSGCFDWTRTLTPIYSGDGARVNRIEG